MRKWVGVILLGVLAACALLALSGCLATENGTRDVAAATPAFTIKAGDLFTEYDANQVAADKKYKDQVIQVSGVVTDIGKDISDTAYVIVGGTGSLDGVQCFFSKDSETQVATLGKGLLINVKGVVQGKPANVVLENCVLQ